MQKKIPPRNNTPSTPTKRLPKTTSTLSNKEGGADHKKDSEKARSYTSECVETTSSRSLEHRHSRCTHVQSRYGRGGVRKTDTSLATWRREHKRRFCRVIWLAFVCAHGSSCIFLCMKMSPGHSRHHLAEGALIWVSVWWKTKN
jgi:hypothetical protein